MTTHGGRTQADGNRPLGKKSGQRKEDNWQGGEGKRSEREREVKSMDGRDGDEPRRADPKIGRMQCGDQ
ncbi:hypothetical protein H109_07642 [Trichophyton interdigitale MR816]|uniref:Uncharacterized protein n=1 Tax=Trichophyton interdigitale (strain MR816) TaxID=1215338 RepID=A0A059IXK5_TRIIM|nr:hypothetical protein H109_07642 [Trichophyton interdigitale MR816]